MVTFFFVWLFSFEVSRNCNIRNDDMSFTCLALLIGIKTVDLDDEITSINIPVPDMPCQFFSENKRYWEQDSDAALLTVRSLLFFL